MDTVPDILKVSILGRESIHCGLHLIPYIARTVLTTLPASVYVLVTDTNVAQFYLSAFEKAFNAEINKARVISIRTFHVFALHLNLTRISAFFRETTFPFPCYFTWRDDKVS
jgi:hypothetical protein